MKQQRIHAAMIALALGSAALTGQAAITTNGDVGPDSTTTTSSDDLYVGYTDDGNMTVDGGSLNRRQLAVYPGFCYDTAVIKGTME